MQFGPAGNSRRFYDEGNKRSEQAFPWLHSMGLTAYEYSMGRGVHLSKETARAIGVAAQSHSIRMSVHAPYFINCASPDPENREKSIGYLQQAAQAGLVLLPAAQVGRGPPAAVQHQAQAGLGLGQMPPGPPDQVRLRPGQGAAGKEDRLAAGGQVVLAEDRPGPPTLIGQQPAIGPPVPALAGDRLAPGLEELRRPRPPGADGLAEAAEAALEGGLGIGPPRQPGLGHLARAAVALQKRAGTHALAAVETGLAQGLGAADQIRRKIPGG